MIDIVLAELQKFSAPLRKEERILLEKMLNQPLKHTGAMTNASSIDIWAFILLSILLEQEKRLSSLESNNDRLADRCLPK
ncbi:MAG: hypothetical protein JNN05_04825 [Candidatus Omnitrophica bacterium]|nr:hypothetical protein [Candidatus Omnitrophota bacterium]